MYRLLAVIVALSFCMVFGCALGRFLKDEKTINPDQKGDNDVKDSSS